MVGKERKPSKALEKEISIQNSGQDIQKTNTIVMIKKKIDLCQSSFETYLSAFLLSNSRRDRDKVLQKREEIKTYKQLLKNELFQPAK